MAVLTSAATSPVRENDISVTVATSTPSTIGRRERYTTVDCERSKIKHISEDQRSFFSPVVHAEYTVPSPQRTTASAPSLENRSLTYSNPNQSIIPYLSVGMTQASATVRRLLNWRRLRVLKGTFTSILKQFAFPSAFYI